MGNFNISKCPFCGSEELEMGCQCMQAQMVSVHSMFKGTKIFHIVCMDCGSIIHSYVEQPEKLKGKK